MVGLQHASIELRIGMVRVSDSNFFLSTSLKPAAELLDPVLPWQNLVLNNRTRFFLHARYKFVEGVVCYAPLSTSQSSY